EKTGVLFLVSQIILILGLLTSCGVDPRWGPPKSGLRTNMAWQYEGAAVAQPTAPVSMMRTKPVFPPPAMAISAIPQQHVFSRDNKVRLVGGRAVAPAHAPDVIKRAVAAGNRMQRYPYKFGGGHARLDDSGYDCSGSVSYVLREAGIMGGQMPSTGFLNYGSAGEGEWITVWAKNGHVYMTIGGLRLDTGGSPRTDGPRWKKRTRSSSGFQARHPAGL
ncbi:MAG: hypothetical protein QNL71_03035, partial [Akkermansiaceae bacterium]